MRIDSGLPIQPQIEIERSQKKPASNTRDESAVTSALSNDVVRLSSLVDQANGAPDIRQEKITQLREAIDSGTYQVSPGALADAIIRDVLNR